MKVSSIRKRRRTLRRGELSNAEKSVVRHRIYERAGGRCELNLLPNCVSGVIPESGHTPWDHWHLVHVKSLGAGGTWDDDNLKGGCHICHLIGIHNPKPCPQKEHIELAMSDEDFPDPSDWLVM